MSKNPVKKKKRAFFPIFLFYLFSIECYAEAALNFYTDFLRHAQEHNPGVQAAYNRWQAEQNRAEAAKVLPDPKLTYGRFIEPIETRIGPQQQKAGISQRFPWFGKLDIRQKAALSRADRAFQKYRSVCLRLARDLRWLYCKSWLLHQETELMRRHIGLLEDTERVAESRVRAGTSSIEVLKTRIELARMREYLTAFGEKRTSLEAELNAVLNRPVRSPVPPITHLKDRSLELPETAFQSLENNPELIELQHGRAESEAGIQAAKKNGMPDITLGVEWIDIGPSVLPSAESGRDAWMASIGINLPLWRGTVNARIRSAVHACTAFDLAVQQKANALRVELETARINYREAERNIVLYRDILLPEVEQLLELSKTGYRSGKTGFFNLIDTQKSILNFQLELARARAGRQIHLAAIETLIGRDPFNEK